MNATTPTVPPSLEGFAKAAAALAEAQGIKRFEMTVEVDFDDEKKFEPKPDWCGSIKVIYWATDGRGRPSRNIRIHYTAKMEAVVEYTPESAS